MTHKYRAIATTVDGIKFPSKAEAKRWGELKLLERAGQIMGLRRQVRIDLAVNGKHVCFYTADFTYFERSQYIVEDSKGMITPEFRLKAKLYAAIFGKDIRLTGKGHEGWVTRRGLKKREASGGFSG
jgi:hypothetical protein